VLALSAFSTIFKLAGIVAFYAWLDPFARFVVRLSGEGGASAVGRLEPAVAGAGGPVALEASWRAILEVAHGAVDASRRRLAGEAVTYQPAGEAIQKIEHFLESLSLETTDLGTIGPRLVRLCHALDHLAHLEDDLRRIPLTASAWQPPPAFQAGASALAEWLDTTKDPGVKPAPTVFQTLQESSNRLSSESKAGRERILEDVALQRMPSAAARAGLDTLGWADAVVYHAWRLAESLRIAAGE
jgi:phosphate:Na+ symporter